MHIGNALRDLLSFAKWILHEHLLCQRNIPSLDLLPCGGMSAREVKAVDVLLSVPTLPVGNTENHHLYGCTDAYENPAVTGHEGDGGKGD